MLALVIVLAVGLALAAGAAVALLLGRERLRREEAVLRSRLAEGERRIAEFVSEADETSRALESAERMRHEIDARLVEKSLEAERLGARVQEIERQRLAHETELDRRLAEAQVRFRALFDASAATALSRSSEQFLKLAEKSFAESREKTTAAVDARVKPIDETLRKTGETLGIIEKSRLDAQARLEQQIRSLGEMGALLTNRTDNLIKALRKPQVRGRYGEIQLQRVAELAGLRSYCDFSTQESARAQDGRLLRPDMVVRLPNGRTLAVDAKTNIEAYLDAIESENPEDAERNLDRFARHVADQAEALAKKEYWGSIEGAFEFVVMFVPGDQFIDAALQRRPDLLDLAAQKNVILASPSTLIGLLRAVHLGWREKSLSDNARELFKLGSELHERAAVALEFAGKVGLAIGQAQQRYNDFVGSVDARLMPTLRRFEEHGASSSKPLIDPAPVEGVTRELKMLKGESAEREEEKTLSQADEPGWNPAPPEIEACR